MTNNYDYLFKFIIIGDSSVGKSCLLLRFTEGRFKPDHEPTLGVEFGSKNISVGENTIKIQIWDTAGQQSFKSITRSYYKGSIATFLVFDIAKRDTFENLNKWLYEVKNHSHQKVEIVLIGNKADLKDRRQVPREEGEKFAQLNGFPYYETSALSGQKVEDIFKEMGRKILAKIEAKEINPDSQTSYGIRKGKKTTKRDSTSSKNIKIMEQENEQNQTNNKKNCCSK